jgi:hypothetical protein
MSIRRSGQSAFTPTIHRPSDTSEQSLPFPSRRSLFDTRAQQVTNLLAQAVAPDPAPWQVVTSFDEKSGIQALKRTSPDRPMQPGRPVKQEFEYRRNGTLTLLAMMDVRSGTSSGLCLLQRTNDDTAEILRLFIGLLLFQSVRRRARGMDIANISKIILM